MVYYEFNDLKVGDTVWISGQAKERGESATIVSRIHHIWGIVDIRFADGHERSISYRCLTLTPPEYKPPVVEISIDNLNDILYYLNDFMRFMGFGREYNKIVNLVEELPLKGRDLSQFPYINRVVNPVETHDIQVPMFKS